MYTKQRIKGLADCRIIENRIQINPRPNEVPLAANPSALLVQLTEKGKMHGYHTRDLTLCGYQVHLADWFYDYRKKLNCKKCLKKLIV